MKFSRRWFLRSAGHAALAIPALPSLLSPSEARAQAAAPDKIFIGFMGAFGGCWADKFFPAMGGAAASRSYAGRTVRSQALPSTQAGGETVVSEVIRGRSSELTPKLLGKMNLLQGIDLPFDVNHHSAATFGNFAQGDAGVAGGDSPTGLSGRAISAHPRSTVDQVLANSAAFYGNLGSVVRRSVTISTFGNLSYWYPGGGEGKSVNAGEIPPSMSLQQLWDLLFAGFSAPKPPRGPVVDLVLEDYRRLRANPRLSKLDKARLDEHVARVEEIQRRMGLVTPTACVAPARPGATPQVQGNNPQSHSDYYAAYKDLVVAALHCGLTRVVSYLFQGWDTTFGTLTQDPFHQLVSHKTDEAAAQAEMDLSRTRMFRDVIVPLASAMDSVTGPDGSSLLDRSLVYFTQEHGTYGHCQENIPVVTFGSARGALKTGLHVDYRDLSRHLPQHYDGSVSSSTPYVGLTFHQMLGSVLQWLDVPRTQWGGPANGAESNHGGYGYRPPNVIPRQSNWRDAVEWAVAGEKLPVISS